MKTCLVLLLIALTASHANAKWIVHHYNIKGDYWYYDDTSFEENPNGSYNIKLRVVFGAQTRKEAPAALSNVYEKISKFTFSCSNHSFIERPASFYNSRKKVVYTLPESQKDTWEADSALGSILQELCDIVRK